MAEQRPCTLCRTSEDCATVSIITEKAFAMTIGHLCAPVIGAWYNIVPFKTHAAMGHASFGSDRPW